MTNLAGLHDREGHVIAPRGTWLLDTIPLSEGPISTDYMAEWQWIVRLNWNYGSTGTLPVPEDYAKYARAAAGYVSGCKGCHRWVIGNEPNLSREWPNGQPIFPWHYAECYQMARSAIHALPGHDGDEVLIAAPGPWNDELKYPGNPNGDWIKYFADVIKACGENIDGFAIHAYTHGYDPALVTSTAHMDAPFQSRYYNFLAYRDYLDALPEEMWGLPCYITEANGNGPWQAVGLMPAMLQEIDDWNQAGGHPIRAVIFYRYPKYDEYAIEGKADVVAEYHRAIGQGYTSPVGVTNVPQTTHIPTVSTGTPPTQPDLPPIDWDERLTARGVKVIEAESDSPTQPLWHLVRARFYNEQEAEGRHHLYISAIDENGQPVNGVPFLARGQGSETRGNTNGYSGFDAANVPMWASEGKNGYSLKMWEGDTVTGLGMGDDTPSGFNAGVHTAIELVFQQRKGAQPQPTPPSTLEPILQPPLQPPVMPALNHPVQDPALRVISQRFGDNPADYAKFGMAGHTGLDFAVPSGTPIVAVDAGQAIELGDGSGDYGIYVKLRHAWGESLYAHLSAGLNLDVGNWVSKEQVIGLSGNTGNSTGPHLHFAMRVNPYQRGAPYDGYSDPQPYLATTAPATPDTDVISAIKQAAREFGLDWQFLASLAWGESSWRPALENGGLFQIGDDTWSDWAARAGATDRANARDNARVAAIYFTYLLRRYNNNYYKALWAWNWGPSRVDAGNEPPALTQEHANKVLHGRDLLAAVGA